MNSPDDWREMRKDNEQIKSLEAQVKELKEPSYEVNRLTTLLAETENARKWWQDKAKEAEKDVRELKKDVNYWKNLHINGNEFIKKLEKRIKELENE
jgi:chromosome segregation ATPase